MRYLQFNPEILLSAVDIFDADWESEALTDKERTQPDKGADMRHDMSRHDGEYEYEKAA
ncbi:hypothetical protein ACMXYO_08755 [Neptuniibacter sp. QD37_6]|uniref:hypothetical protein n=1 Tax=Neptuniibacter sp. QD37_6 TaxID=3398210 RepID=UPI0039F4F85D